MSAPLSNPLFHGTSATLRVGNVIEPRGDVAWASTETGEARHAAKRELTGVPHHLMFGKDETHSVENYQLPMFNPVYTVEPVDKEETERTTKDRGIKGNVKVSNKGFRVTGVHSWESTPL